MFRFIAGSAGNHDVNVFKTIGNLGIVARQAIVQSYREVRPGFRMRRIHGSHCSQKNGVGISWQVPCRELTEIPCLGNDRSNPVADNTQ